MKLYQQLILFVLAATLIPILVGFVILRHSEHQLESRLLLSREESAARLADVVLREMKEILERVQGALGYFSIEEMSKEELVGFLGILYKQSEDITQVAFLDESGSEMAPGVYLDHPERYPEYVGRLSVSEEAHKEFLSDLPLKNVLAASPGSVVVGSPHPLKKSGTLGISLLVPWLLSSGKGRWLAAVELSLERIIRRVVDTGDTQGLNAFLVDGEGKVIAHPDRSKVINRTDLSGAPAVARVLSSKDRGAFFDEGSVTAFAKVPLFGWGIVVSQSRLEAWAEVRRTRRVTVTWTGISILALLVLGGLFTGRITKNLRRFAHSAEEFGRGNLNARIHLQSRDELGLLARTFNRMGEELKASREEIEAWNRELALRVEERTRELEVAHRRLLETSKLAAIGQLGAGVAHEINNPLVGILGNVQLMMMKLQGAEENMEVLKKIEAAAKRCKEVTHNLLRFSEQEADPEHIEVDLHQVLLDAFSLTEQRMKAQHITTYWELGSQAPKVMGDHRQLMQVFLNLFANARTAMKNSGTLTVSTRWTKDDMLEISVVDTGKGILPEHLDRIFEPFFTTKDEWTEIGLGLSVAYRIVSDHGGQITAESEPGRGSTFRVLLPTCGEQS